MPLEHLLALATPRAMQANESHTTSVGSGNQSNSPGASQTSPIGLAP